MILNEAMVEILRAIRRIEVPEISKMLDVPVPELGNCLIYVYCNTENLTTRELITEFMEEAGPVWVRKLMTRDMSKIASSPNVFASLDDYVELLAANDGQAVRGLIAN